MQGLSGQIEAEEIEESQNLERFSSIPKSQLIFFNPKISVVAIQSLVK